MRLSKERWDFASHDKLPQTIMAEHRSKTGSGKPPTPAERRQLRLEEQLRANLQKRKAQARSRRDGEKETSDDGESDALPLPRGPVTD